MCTPCLVVLVFEKHKVLVEIWGLGKETISLREIRKSTGESQERTSRGAARGKCKTQN